MKHTKSLVLFFVYLICSSAFINSLESMNLPLSISQSINKRIFEKNSQAFDNNGPLSFIELESKNNLLENTKSNSELQNLIELELKNSFSSQFFNGRKRRYTEDGRPCAAAFSQNGQTFYDCTSSRSPDGQLKNREWCYVNPGEKGTKWGYCKPVMNYDKVREANQRHLKLVTQECRKVQDEIESFISPVENILNELKRIIQNHADLDNKVNLIVRQVQTIKSNVGNLFSIKSNWEKEEVKILKMNEKIVKKKEKMKTFKSKEKEYYDDTEATINAETIAQNHRISAVLQRRLKINDNTCDGMLAYEEEKFGDGIIGHYFDNEAWIGSFSERKDDSINFEWTGASPKKGINKNNFSVKWSGYLSAPYSGKYVFSLESDDGSALTINNELIISHNMHTSEKENSSRTDRWLNNEISKKSNPNKNHFKSSSEKIHLVGGSKYKIVVTYFHSVHDSYTEDETSFMRLKWATEEWEEQVIPKKFYYSKNTYAPIKITGFPPDLAIARTLLENDLAFRNSKTYLIQDIPNDYLGAPTLKFNSRVKDKVVSFNANSPVIVFIAILAHYANPLPEVYEDTQQSMSLVEIEEKVNKNQKKILARRSGMLKIYKSSYGEGKINIPLKSNGFNAKGVPMLMWFMYNQNAGGPVTCGGREINISNSNGSYFKSCKASSEKRGTFCTHGFNERMKDKTGGMWYSRGEGLEAWIQVRFKGLFVLTKLVYRDKNLALGRNSVLELKFDDGSTQLIETKNTDETQEFDLEAVKTSSVLITIKGVFGTSNNGGAFKILGVKCTNIEKKSKSKLGIKDTSTLPALFKNEDKEMLKLRCNDSVANSRKFNSISKTVGTKVLIYCSETCSLSDFSIYGDLVYTKDSAICKAAYHSQKLQSEGGKVWLVIQNGRNGYKSQLRNGVRSESKSRSEFSVTFEAYLKKDEIILEVGSKIDVRNPYKPGFLPGIITRLINKDVNKYLIDVSIEGNGSEIMTINYPNKKKIKACGEKIKNRQCEGSRRNLNLKQPIKIRFTPEDYFEDGNYLPDNGYTYGHNNRPFGWNKSMKGKIRQFNDASKPELHSFIEFPPSPKSEKCSAPNSHCAKVSWSVRVGIGRFFVRLYVGDPENYTKADLKINGKYFAKNKIIQPNELKVYEAVVEARNEFLVLKNKCKKNCDYASAKINAIEIIPFEDKPKKKEEKSLEIATTCGHAFTGGRCDKGPDVLHCLFEDPSKEIAGNCTGSQVIMMIPSTYHCRDQVGKYKCMMKVYSTPEECQKYCVNNCKKKQCIG